ncbi:hypothetical protein C8J56DRAFT_1034283 [Mycena floridula]|nr:hypothetical protein C8J56DRAFT_1034283 [Mycena floridula]
MLQRVWKPLAASVVVGAPAYHYFSRKQSIFDLPKQLTFDLPVSLRVPDGKRVTEMQKMTLLDWRSAEALLTENAVFHRDTRPPNGLIWKRTTAWMSSRPYLPMAFLMGWKDQWASRSTDLAFGLSANMQILRNYWLKEEARSPKFMKECLTAPDRPAEHCFQYMRGAIVLRVSYRYRAKDHDDPFIKAGNDVMKLFNKGCAPASGTYMVNQIRYIPEWFPGAEFEKMARL